MSAASADDHRELMTAFPTGVAVVTGMAGDGTPHGMTCTSLVSVTLAPPTLLVCLNVRSGTLAAVRETGLFGVNLLHRHARRAAEVFATARVRRFALVPWRATMATGVPWLTEDAFALAECRLTRTMVTGDHEVVLGEVVTVCRRYEVPLMYGMRQFGEWTGAVLPEPATRAGLGEAGGPAESPGPTRAPPAPDRSPLGPPPGAVTSIR